MAPNRLGCFQEIVVSDNDKQPIRRVGGRCRFSYRDIISDCDAKEKEKDCGAASFRRSSHSDRPRAEIYLTSETRVALGVPIGIATFT